MSKQLKVGDRVVFHHTNPNLHDPRDGTEAEITKMEDGGLSFGETAYLIEFHGGEEGIAFRSELRLAEVVLVE